MRQIFVDCTPDNLLIQYRYFLNFFFYCVKKVNFGIILCVSECEKMTMKCVETSIIHWSTYFFFLNPVFNWTIITDSQRQIDAVFFTISRFFFIELK